MPYQTVWIDPELFLEHQGIRIYHTYKDDDVDQGARTYTFTMNKECSELDALCDEENCRHVFEVQALSTWNAPPQSPYCTGENDTPENRQAWTHYWDQEEQAIRTAFLRAIEQGELTTKGHTKPKGST